MSLDPPRQVVEFELHDRAAARIEHEHPGEGEHPRRERRDDRLHARLLPRAGTLRPLGEVSDAVTNGHI